MKHEVKTRWMDIEGYEGMYKISEHGEVLSLKFHRKNLERCLKPIINEVGYVFYFLSKNGKSKRHYSHRLVAGSFLPKRPGTYEVNHLDGDKTNNHFSNLQWCTPSENTKHAYDTGLKIAPIGTASKLSKLTKEQVVIIKRSYKPYKVSMESLAKQYGVTKQTICGVIHGKTYKDIG